MKLLSELAWRDNCRESLVEYARTIPIPGVPQSDNYERLLELGQVDTKGKPLWEFDDGRYDDAKYIPKIDTKLADHHILLLETCQAMVEERLIAPDGTICRRVQVYMPPGSAKSTYGSVVFPTWCLGKFPEYPIILTGYADMICKKHGKRSRQVCQSVEYQAIFETTISKHTKAADDWELTNGSSHLAAGLQSGLTGNRASGLIWDDPIKGRRAAESLTEQIATFEAYKDDARTRKIPTGWELGIQTRWAEGDLAGRLLPVDWSGESGYVRGQDGYWWYVLCIQAEAQVATDPLGRKKGQYLWPEWFPSDYWEPLKLDSRSWNSLYQQIPTPPEGEYFKLPWVQYYDHLPKDLNIYMSADYAVTDDAEATDPDWSVIGVWGVDTAKKIYFIDGWFDRTEADQWIEQMLDLAKLHQPLAHVAGAGQIRRAIEPFAKSRMRDRGVFVRLVWYPETHSKQVNARSFQAMMSSGQVYWPRGHSLAEWVIRNLLGFGTLTHDDGVDMCSMIGRHLAHMWEAEDTTARDKPPLVINEGGIPISSLMPKPRHNQSRW